MSYPIYYVEANDTLPHLFDTFDGGTGASITMTGLAVGDILIYKDGSVTQRASTSGFTLLDTDGIDFDTLTGIHGFSIDLSDNTDAGFYAVGSWYHVVISSITVDAQTVSFVACAFRIVSATRGMAGTALPDAAADAAGGLPVSDLGGLDMDAILVDTNSLNDTKIPDTISLANINAQADTALTDYDPPTRAELTTDVNSILAQLPSDAPVEGTADSGTTLTMVDAARTEADTDYWKGSFILFTSGTISGQARLITAFTPATDTITFTPATTQAVATNTYRIIPAAYIEEVLTLTGHTAQTGDSFARIGAAGAGLTAIDLPDQTMNITGDITGNLSGSVGSVTGAVGSVTGNVTGSVGSLAAQAKTDVNAEVVDVLKTDTVTLPGQTAPPLAPTMEQALGWLYKVLRNRKSQTSTQWSLYADDETTVDAKATVSDDGTTAIKQEIVTGP